MRFIVCFTITVIYSFGLSISNPTRSIGPLMKVHMTHAHEVDSDHHQHDIEGGQEVDHHQNADAKHEHENNVPHSHDIFVSVAGNYITMPTPILAMLSLPRIEVKYSVGLIASPPKDPTMGSIFRPPIS